MIFVLGSNEGGLHGTGAATFAVKKHGAKAGQAFGLQGTAFGIPTQEVKMRNGRRVVGDSLLLQQIRTYVNQCIDFAKERPEMEFEVTQIGGGLAGFRPKQVAPWFENAADNCLFEGLACPPRRHETILEDEMTRRGLRLSILCFLIFAFCLASCHKQPASLNLLVWEGYADPAFVHAFEEAHHCKVTASYMGSSDDLVAKLRGGSASTYDVISPSSDVATSIARAGLAEPLDLSKFPAYLQLSPKLRELPLVKVGGQTLGVPFMWGPNPLLYDTTAFPQAPDSWAVFWDPKYKGKISVWDDLSTLYMAAQLLGYAKPDPSHLYNLADDELAAVKQKLLALKPNVRKLWSTGGELTNLFQNHEIIAAMGWPLMTNQLRQAGFPIAETIPKENTTGWIDHLMITKASPNKDLAYDFLEFMIQAQTQKKISDVTHYTPANPAAAQFMTDAERKGLHLDDPDAYMARIYFWQDVPRRAKYIEVWNEVKAAQ